MYDIVKNSPIAKFYYKGNHSHPVRRTILIIESNKDFVTGYELREGSITRKLDVAPVKSYNRARIARWSQLGRNKHRVPGPNWSTLQRFNLLELVKTGI
jgi:hypothetical protein